MGIIESAEDLDHGSRHAVCHAVEDLFLQAIVRIREAHLFKGRGGKGVLCCSTRLLRNEHEHRSTHVPLRIRVTDFDELGGRDGKIVRNRAGTVRSEDEDVVAGGRLT